MRPLITDVIQADDWALHKRYMHIRQRCEAHESHGNQAEFDGHPGSVRHLPAVALAKLDEDRMTETVANREHSRRIVIVLEMQHVQNALLLLLLLLQSVAASVLLGVHFCFLFDLTSLTR